MNMLWKMIIVIMTSVVTDQVSKAYVQQHFFLGESIPVLEGFFNFTYVRNTGAAFGMGAGAQDWVRIFFFLVIPVLACLWIMYLIWKTRNTEKFSCFCFTLILSGAIGNLIDRFILGHVIDFLDFYYSGHHFPAFNVADSCITVGAILLIAESIFVKKEKNE